MKSSKIRFELRPSRCAILAAAIILLAPARTRAQGLGNLVSPGPLSRAHASLEGLNNCRKCHEPGRKVTAALCLACHRPVGDRILAKKGVHRAVKDDCVRCHAEHAGRDAELRPIDRRRFDHRTETGFPLEGRHAALDCAKCHPARSFLTASPACSSCHADPHRGRYGLDCARCHPVSVPFKETRKTFDHSATKYPLTGGHRAVACAKCHGERNEKEPKFSSCADCHHDPHRKSLGECAACHTTEGFRTQKIDHSKTGYPLRGRHAEISCAACHVQPATKVRLKAERCADCHRDPHRGTFREDCAACHNETGFRGAPFDHAARTRFALEERHREIPCAACHKGASPAAVKSGTADFRGARSECASCHRDPHGGLLGTACQNCHGTRSFKLSSYRHPRDPEFFAGGHAAVACASCHRSATPGGPTRYKGLSFSCSSCHRDVHLGQVGDNCESCHAVDAPKFAPKLFSHTRAKFPLTGRHLKAECAKCHPSEKGDFPAGPGTAVRLRGISSECRACHADPHLGQVGFECQKCHTTETFHIQKYVHLGKGLEAFFTGKHSTAACEACHKKVEGAYPSGRGTAVRYRGTGTECASCHQDPHQGALGARCSTCHSPSAWKNASRAFHKAEQFPLEGKHLLAPCASCHWNGVLRGTPTRCYDCHWIRRQDDRYQTRLGNECEDCHNPTAWPAVRWDHASRTGFPLNAAHRSLACESCHRGQVFTGTPADCYSCHRKDYERSKDPAHAAAGFPTTCQDCHKASDPTWHQARFNHSAYPLVGVHATTACSSCHKNNVYLGTPTDCYACHQTPYQQAVNPNHLAAGFSTTCQSCHKASDPSWQLGTFNHSTTAFALVGVHATQACTACHKNNVYKGLPSDCFSCHLTQFQQSANPNHAAAGFPTTCQSCHKASDPNWQLGTFNHSTTAFALVGVHATQLCSACHKNNVFKGLPSDCASCHLTQFQQSANPNHAAAGFPTTCQSCHKASDPNWQLGTFDHSTTIFPLLGLHAMQTCSTCHKNNVFKGLPSDCVSCHLTQFQQSANPNHAAAGFPTTCQTCHKASDPNWQLGTFNHSTTAFALVGVHATQACTACHKNNVFKGLPSDCFSCHLIQYQQAANPNHAAAGFPTTCQSCHKASDPNWQLGAFDHSTTAFPLVGIHATQACTACHKNNVFKGLPSDCFSCHLIQYQQAANPNHVAAGFPTTCQSCHKASDTTWQQGVFNHSTFYALLGVHATQACSACHINNVYAGTSTDCYACHQTPYQQAVNPNHVAAGFPTTCQSCHKASDTTWQQGVFNHSTFYALLGVHATQPCSACHINNVYAGTPTDCYACHQTVYQQSTNPNHIAAGIPTTCLNCHTASDSSWLLGTFNHSFYPLLGLHASQQCITCHTSNVYQGLPSDCYSCHQAVYLQTTNPNHIAAGFPTTCQTCHKASDTSWLQGTFNHTWFPITSGPHSGNPCSACHTDPNNFAVFTCLTCHDRATTDSHHTGVSGYVYNSAACYSCHPTGTSGD